MALEVVSRDPYAARSTDVSMEPYEFFRNRFSRRTVVRGLQGKAALVTGAGSGIGLAIARRLAEEGMVVGVLDINAEAGRKVVDEIQAAGGKADFESCDITSYDAVKSAVA